LRLLDEFPSICQLLAAIETIGGYPGCDPSDPQKARLQAKIRPIEGDEQ
jgi:hypothetical protein